VVQELLYLDAMEGVGAVVVELLMGSDPIDTLSNRALVDRGIRREVANPCQVAQVVVVYTQDLSRRGRRG